MATVWSIKKVQTVSKTVTSAESKSTTPINYDPTAFEEAVNEVTEVLARCMVLYQERLDFRNQLFSLGQILSDPSSTLCLNQYT